VYVGVSSWCIWECFAPIFAVFTRVKTVWQVREIIDIGDTSQ
jgi:hypothetical protein